VKFHSFYLFLFILTNISLAPFLCGFWLWVFVSGAGKEPSKEADCQNGGGRRQGEWEDFANGPNGMEQCNIHVLLLIAEILHQLIGSLFHYLQGFIHPRWCRISSINSRGT